MDVSSLVAVHMLKERCPTKISSSDEDRYYRDQITLPRQSLRMLGSIVASGCVILLLVSVALV